jgi:transketolase
MSQLEWNELDEKAVKVAKILAADAVEKVGNGHPGSAVSLAPAAYLLFNKVMNLNPADTTWRGRDRFILSIGHSSVTQYIQLYLTGAGLELDDLKALRTYGSLTPGHPEYAHTKGVEITTGPLGQGISSAVGFAMAQRFEKATLEPIKSNNGSAFDHFVYTITGDGCLQEGVSAEAASLAGVHKLGNIIMIWDDNRITIEGDTKVAFQEDVLKRYEAYGWDVSSVDWTNGGTEYKEDVHALYDAIEAAKRVTDKPSLIRLSTLIAWPTPGKTGSASSHGSKLGTEAVAGLKSVLGFDPNKTFEVPNEVIEYTRNQAAEKARDAVRLYNEQISMWKINNSDKVALFDRLYNQGPAGKPNQPKAKLGALPDGLDAVIDAAARSFEAGKDVATRAASGTVINEIAKIMPEFWGGSADLAGSNNTTIKDALSFGPSSATTADWKCTEGGRVIHFGIREHAMGQIVNGIVLSGNTRVFGGTFFQFADYMRDSARIAALQGIPSVFVWTHDSIAVGEDGPTHQPVEHLTAMRSIPGFNVARPADGAETAYCWLKTLQTYNNPTGLILSRQNLENLPHYVDGAGFADAKGAVKGGYILLETGPNKGTIVDGQYANVSQTENAEGQTPGIPDVIIIATGSEVSLAVIAAQSLGNKGITARVVSMPSIEWFEEQTASYKESVLPSSVRARVSVEAGIALSWHKYLGDAGEAVSLEHFGASGDPVVLYKEFGITSEAVEEAANKSIEKAAGTANGTIVEVIKEVIVEKIVEVPAEVPVTVATDNKADEPAKSSGSVWDNIKVVD